MRVINGTSPSVWKAHTNSVVKGTFLGSQVYCIILLLKHMTYRTRDGCMEVKNS